MGEAGSERGGTIGRAVNDWGGQPAPATVDREEHANNLYEKRVDALLMLVSRSGRRITVDAHRRAQEQLRTEDYATLPYYDRWLVTLRRNLVEAGVLTDGEIARKLHDIRAREGVH